MQLYQQLFCGENVETNGTKRSVFQVSQMARHYSEKGADWTSVHSGNDAAAVAAAEVSWMRQVQ